MRVNTGWPVIGHGGMAQLKSLILLMQINQPLYACIYSQIRVAIVKIYIGTMK